MKLPKILIALPLVAIISACGGGGSSSGGGSGTVDYTVDPVAGVTCRNNDGETRTDTLVSCTWNCAVNNITTGENRGVRGVWGVNFQRRDDIWSVLSEGVVTPCPA